MLIFTMYCSQICLRRKLKEKKIFSKHFARKTKRDAWLVLNYFCSIILPFSLCDVLFNKKTSKISPDFSKKSIKRPLMCKYSLFFHYFFFYVVFGPAKKLIKLFEIIPLCQIQGFEENRQAQNWYISATL